MSRSPLRRVRSANDEFQLALSLLTSRKQRQRQRRFIVEGVRSIDEAVRAAWKIDSFWTAEGRPLSAWAVSLLESGVASAHVELPQTLMTQLSAKDDPSELVASVEIPDDDLARIEPRLNALVVVFDRPVSPGNLGSIIRTCDALGADGLVVTGHAADLYDPQTVRASMGSLFALPVVRAESSSQVLEWVDALRPHHPGLRVVGSSAHATTALPQHDFTRPTVIVLGNETKGLSWAWKQACDAVVLIPMAGSADSLNVAAAAAVLLYEVERQRGQSATRRA